MIGVTDISQYHTVNNNPSLGRPWLLAARFPSWYDASHTHLKVNIIKLVSVILPSYSESSLSPSRLDSHVNSTILHTAAPGSSESHLPLNHCALLIFTPSQSWKLSPTSSCAGRTLEKEKLIGQRNAYELLLER